MGDASPLPGASSTSYLPKVPTQGRRNEYRVLEYIIALQCMRRAATSGAPKVSVQPRQLMSNNDANQMRCDAMETRWDGNNGDGMRYREHLEQLSGGRLHVGLGR